MISIIMVFMLHLTFVIVATKLILGSSRPQTQGCGVTGLQPHPAPESSQTRPGEAA